MLHTCVMSLIQTKYPLSAANLDNSNDEYAVSWTNPTNALTSNNLYATASFGDYPEDEDRPPSQYLHLYNCQFSLPENAVVDGIRVVVERYGVGDVDDYYVALTYLPDPDSTMESTMELTTPGKQKTGYWPGSDGTAVYGGESDTWNRTWLPAEINDNTNFGFAIAAEGSRPNLDAANVDGIQVRVYYHGGEEGDSTGGASIGDVTTSEQITFNPVLTGTALVGGHAPFVYDNIAAQGGVGVGGAADIPAPTIFMLGGITAGGVADAPQDVVCCEGGAGVSGEASVTAEYTPYIPVPFTAGLNASGAATAIDSLFAQGGASPGGEAEATGNYNPPVEGGVQVSILSFVNPVWMEGGALYSGEASVDVLYETEEGSGGAELSGETVPVLTVPVEGGIVAGALPIDEVCLKLPEVSGGALFETGDFELALITPYWDDVGGGVDVSPISFVDPYLPTGGAGLGGEADFFVGFVPTLQEYQWINYLTGEEHNPPETNDESGWAFCWLNPDTDEFGWDLRFSFADPENARLLTIRGPAEKGADGDLQLRIGNLSGPNFISPVVGSTTLTTEQKDDLLAGLWYWRIQNHQFENLRSQIEVRAGIDVGGTAIFNTDVDAEGGVLASPEPAETGRYNPEVVLGGSSASGEADISLEAPAAGGVVHGGAADVTSVYNRTPEGGAQVNGDAYDGLAYEAFTSGGALVNGSGPIGIAPAVSGGILAGGDHDRSFIGTFFPTGGALASPNHFQQFTDYIIAEGGARAGGKTIGENLRTYTKTHLNYGYAMGSENIFTRVTYEHELIPPTDDETPEMAEDEFRIEHEPGWCDVEEKCEEGTLPKVIQRRQGQHLPPKIGRTTRRDRSIARAAL